jgi:hypothetical protein
MSNAPNPEDAGQQDLDAIAQELLGIDTSGTGFDDVLDLDDDDLPPIESSQPLEAETVEATDVESAAESGGPRDDLTSSEFDDEFGGGLGLFDEAEEEEGPAPQATRKTPVADAMPAREQVSKSRSAPTPPPHAPVATSRTVEREPVAVPAESEPTPPATAPVSEDESDDYWDALDGWDWEESDTVPQKTADEETPSPTRPVTTRKEVGRIADSSKIDEFLEDAEFGAGLEEGSERASQRDSERPARRRRDDEPREAKGKRGRRRRGRKPREKSTDVPAEPAEVPESDLSESDLMDSDLTDVIDEDEEENFGAGLEVSERSSDEGRPARRRRSRGRRPASRDREAAPEKDSGPPADELDESDVDESQPSGEDKYRNVPTWEEAISSLVQVKRRSGSSERSSQKDGRHPEGSGRSRRGGGRGRGRGRRRPSE